MRPIIPQPGYTRDDVLAVINSRQFQYADIYTISTQDGSILRYTTTQRTLELVPLDAAPGSTTKYQYTSKLLKVSGIKLKLTRGTEVDEQTLQLDYTDSLNYLGAPWSKAILQGRLDGGIVRRDRFFSQGPGQPYIGGSPLFVGRVSTADTVGRSTATIKVKSDLVLTDIDMPRKIFGGQCTRTIFDSECGLNRDDFQVAGVVGAGAEPDTIPWVGVNDGFNFGVIHIADNSGATQVRTIKAVDVSNIYLVAPLNYTPVAGTNFVAYPGCVRTYARCQDFNNTEHFQAFEFVPKPETAYQ